MSVEVVLQKRLPHMGHRDQVLEHDSLQRPRKSCVYVDVVLRVQAEYDCEDIPEQIDAKKMGGLSSRPSKAQPARQAAIKEIEAKVASLTGA